MCASNGNAVQSRGSPRYCKKDERFLGIFSRSLDAVFRIREDEASRMISSQETCPSSIFQRISAGDHGGADGCVAPVRPFVRTGRGPVLFLRERTPERMTVSCASNSV